MNLRRFKKEYDVSVVSIRATVYSTMSISVIVTEKSTGRMDKYGWDVTMSFGAEPYFCTFEDRYGSSEDMDETVADWIVSEIYDNVKFYDLVPMADPDTVAKFEKLEESYE